MEENKFTRPLVDEEELETSTDEEINYKWRHLLNTKCKSLVSKFMDLPKDDTHYLDLATKQTLCFLYYMSPSVRKCMDEDFLFNDDFTEESWNKVNACLDSNQKIGNYYGRLVHVIRKPTSSFMEKYKNIVLDRINSNKGNYIDRQDWLNDKVCFDESENYKSCVFRASEQLGVDAMEMIDAVRNRKTDYCYMEQQQLEECALASFHAEEIYNCMQNRDFFQCITEARSGLI